SMASDKQWAHEVRRQLLNPFQYGDNEPDQSGRIDVLDLNLRNNLASEVVHGALKRLVELSAPCPGCPRDRCDGVRNAARLGDAIVIDRLVALLTLVAKSGYHATMRDLLGFLSYTLWGTRDCDAVKGTRTPVELYAKNAFVGGIGPL